MRKLVWLLAPLALLLAACGGGSATLKPPAAPTGFTATATSASRIDLAWDEVANATSYQLERRSGDGVFAEIATPSADATSYANTDLQADTTYTYRLRSRNSAGASGWVEATVTTRPAGGGDGGGNGGGDGGGDGGGNGGEDTELFTMTLKPAALTIVQSGSDKATAELRRKDGFAGGVQFSLTGAIVGTGADKVTYSFTPNPATGGSGSLTLTVGSEVPAGQYDLTVRAQSGATTRTATLRLTVTAPAKVLLVDDDRSDNNYASDDPKANLSPSDLAFRELLGDAGIAYDVFVVRSDYQATGDGPGYDTLSKYETVIWYTGENYGGRSGGHTLSGTDELNLGAFLDLEDRRLVLISGAYFRTHVEAGWGLYEPGAEEFAVKYLGFESIFSALNFADDSFRALGTGALAGMELRVAGNVGGVTAHRSVGVTRAGTDTFLTNTIDLEDGNGDQTLVISTGRKGVGTAGSSTAVFVGFPLENVTDVGPSSKAAFLEHLLAY